MTQVLFISYYFPPTGGAPAQRSLKFVRYLPQHGYLPVVITGPGTSHNEWTPYDPSLFKEVSSSVRIYRASTPIPQSGNKMRRRSERWLGVASAFSRWWNESVISLGEQVLKEQRPRLIYASMSPFETAEAASLISRKHRIPWVADLRDPWAIDEIQVYPSVFHREFARNNMRRLLSSASLIVMNTPEAKASLLRYFPDLAEKRVITITNGFDSEDFENAPPFRGNGKFTIAHTGSFLTDAGLLHRRRRRTYEFLGGAVPGIDIATRSHLYLFDAIHQWCRLDPNVKNDLQIVFAGNAARSGNLSAVEEFVLQFTRFEGYLPREQSLGIAQRADVLFLAMHNLPAGQRSTTAPSKMYEYMASGRPILAAVPDGDAREYLEKAGTAVICRPDDSTAIREGLRKLYNQWKTGEHLPQPNQQFIRRFERRHLTETLASEFDNLLGANDVTSERYAIPAVI